MVFMDRCWKVQPIMVAIFSLVWTKREKKFKHFPIELRLPARSVSLSSDLTILTYFTWLLSRFDCESKPEESLVPSLRFWRGHISKNGCTDLIRSSREVRCHLCCTRSDTHRPINASNCPQLKWFVFLIWIQWIHISFLGSWLPPNFELAACSWHLESQRR